MGEHGYFEHDADIGIIGMGETVEEAFESAATALFSIQSELSEIRPTQTVTVDFPEEDLDYALVTWLNKLVSLAQSRKLALCAFRLKRTGSDWHGEADGACWNSGMTRGVEVKGATLTGLSVKLTNHTWEARCVVDV